MSLHFEVVLTCFLRDDTPTTVLEALRWHLGLTTERPTALDADEHAYPLLGPDPDSRPPGGDFASLQRQFRGFAAGRELYAWGLFSRDWSSTLRLDTWRLGHASPEEAVSGGKQQQHE